MLSSAIIRVLGVHQRREEKIKLLRHLLVHHQNNHSNSSRSHSTAAAQHQIKRRPPHVPVMANEVIEHLQPLDSDQIIVDMTFGAGGHTKRILDAASDGVRVIALDRGLLENL